MNNLFLDDESESKEKDDTKSKTSTLISKVSYAEATSAKKTPVKNKSTDSKKPTLAMLSIQVKAGSLNQKRKEECAEKMFLDNMIIRCSVNENCEGCKYCESQKNIDFMIANQLALVFSFGPAEFGAPPVEKQVFKGNGTNASTSTKLTVIFNNGPEYLRGLWGGQSTEIFEIIKDIMAFSWLPHNFIERNRGTGAYHHNQILENYLDKPLFPEFSDLFREELGWSDIVNSKEKKEAYEELIQNMNVTRR